MARLVQAERLIIHSQAPANPVDLRTQGQLNDWRCFGSLFLLDFCMPDGTKSDEPVPFPVEVTVNGVTVTVTLMLKPGTTVTRKQKPEPPKSAPPSET